VLHIPGKERHFAAEHSGYTDCFSDQTLLYTKLLNLSLNLLLFLIAGNWPEIEAFLSHRCVEKIPRNVTVLYARVVTPCRLVDVYQILKHSASMIRIILSLCW
jgi:hypothetical protein